MDNNNNNKSYRESVKILDKAYDITKNKYNDKQAREAIFRLLNDGDFDAITRDNNARNDAKKSLHYYNIFYILANYILSTFKLHNLKITISAEEFIKYVNDLDIKLNVDRKKALEIMMLAIANNPFYALNILACNNKVKQAIIEGLIDERYTNNKRRELDDTGDAICLSYIEKGKKKMIIASREKIYNSLKQMNNDDKLDNIIKRK